MNPVEPTVPIGSHLVVFAKDQPQYLPLPASVATTRKQKVQFLVRRLPLGRHRTLLADADLWTAVPTGVPGSAATGVWDEGVVNAYC